MLWSRFGRWHRRLARDGAGLSRLVHHGLHPILTVLPAVVGCVRQPCEAVRQLHLELGHGVAPIPFSPQSIRVHGSYNTTLYSYGLARKWIERDMMRTRTNSVGTNHNTICATSTYTHHHPNTNQLTYHDISHPPADLYPSKQIIAPPALRGNIFHHIQDKTWGV